MRRGASSGRASPFLAALHAAIVALALAPGVVAAGPASDVSDPALALAAVDWRTEAWPELAVPVWDRVRERIGREDAARLEAEVAGLLDPERLGAAVRARATLERDALDPLLAFAATETGGALARAQAASFDGALLRTQPVFLTELFRDPLTGTRRAVIERLERALHLSEDVMRIALVEAQSAAFAAALLACVPGDGAPRASAAAARVERWRPRVRRRMLVSLEFVHRERATLDLAHWGELSERPEIARWHRGFSSALEAVLVVVQDSLAARAEAWSRIRCQRAGVG